MTPEPTDDDNQGRLADLAADALDVLAAIRARAQLTRRRVGRVDELSRDHIGADLAQIERHAERLARLISPLQRDGSGSAVSVDRGEELATARRAPDPRPGRPRPAARPDRTA